jgi:hypothetical protein
MSGFATGAASVLMLTWIKDRGRSDDHGRANRRPDGRHASGEAAMKLVTSNGVEAGKAVTAPGAVAACCVPAELL